MTVKVTSALAVTLAISSGFAFSAVNEQVYHANEPVKLSLKTDKQLSDKNLIIVAMADTVDASTATNASTSNVNPSVEATAEPITSIAGGVGATAGRSAASIKYGEVSVTPTIGIHLGYNDNVTNSLNNKISSSILGLTPKIVASIDKSSNKFSLTYAGDLIYLPDSTADNRNTHNFILAGDHVVTTRNRFNWALSYINGAEARGISDSSRIYNGLTLVPDEFRTYDAKAAYLFGAPGAKVNLELKSNYTDKEYTNNRAITTTRDYSLFNYGGEVQYRIAPKTQIVLDVNQSQIDYKSAASTQSSTETKYLVGTRWKALAKTEGYFKIGRGTKDFDSAGLAQGSTTVYESGVKWAPLTYSVFDVSFARNYVDGSSDLNRAGISRIINASWNHQWKSYLKTTASAMYGNASYGDTGRIDKTDGYKLSAVYDAKRWLGLGVDYSYVNRDSNDINFSYTSNLVYFSALLSM